MDAQQPADDGSTRRDLLARLALGGAAAAALGSLCGCALFESSVSPDVILAPDGGTLLVPCAALPWEHGAGDALVVGITGRPDDKLLLLRTTGGEIVALSTRCTHRGCDVRWRADRGRIVCPCHGSEFDVHGGNVQGPAQRPLHRYDVQARGKDLAITLG